MNSECFSFKTLSLTIAFLYIFNTIAHAAPVEHSTLRQPASVVSEVRISVSAGKAKSGIHTVAFIAIIAAALVNLHTTAGSEGSRRAHDYLREATEKKESIPNATDVAAQKDRPRAPTTEDFIREAIGKAESDPNDVQAIDKEAIQERIDKLIRRLGDVDPVARRPVIKELVEIGPRAVPALIKALKSNADPNVRLNIVAVLGEIGGLQTVEPLARTSVTDRDPYVRHEALRALEKVREKIAAAEEQPTPIAELPRQPVVEEPSTGKAEPGTLDWSSGMQTIRTIIKNFSESVRLAVTETIAQIEKERAVALEKKTEPKKVKIVEAPTEVPVTKVVEVTETTEIVEAPTPTEGPVTESVEPPIVVETPVEPVTDIEPITEIVEPPTEEIVETPNVIFRPPTTIELHIKDLANKYPSVHSRGIEELVKVGPPAIIPLSQALADKENSPDVRKRYVQALERIGSPQAMEALTTNGLGDEDTEVRRATVGALVRNSRTAIGPLNDFISKTTDPVALKYAKTARRNIRFRSVIYYSPIVVIPALILGIGGFIFGNYTKTGRRIIRRLCGWHKPRVFLDNQHFQDRRVPKKKTGPDEAGSAVEHTGRATVTEKIQAVLTAYLGDEEPKTAAPPAEHTERPDEDPGQPDELAEETATASARVAADVPAVPAAPDKTGQSTVEAKLLKLLGNKNPIIRIIAALTLAATGDKRAVQVLIEALRLPEDSLHMIFLKRRAIIALGRTGAPSVVPALDRLLEGPTTTVPIRRLAKEVIDRFEPPQRSKPVTPPPSSILPQAKVLHPDPVILGTIAASA